MPHRAVIISHLEQAKRDKLFNALSKEQQSMITHGRNRKDYLMNQKGEVIERPVPQPLKATTI